MTYSTLQEQMRMCSPSLLEGKVQAESTWNKAWLKLTPMLAAWGIQAPRITANEAGLDALRKILRALKTSDGPYAENMWSAVAAMHDAMRRIVEPGAFGDIGWILAKSFPAKLAAAKKHAVKAKKNIDSYKELKPQIDTLKNHPNLRSNRFLWSLYNQLYAHGKPLSPKQQAVLDKILGEQTSDGWEYTGGPGCDVCGYGSVENVDEYDPARPCPDCGVTMIDGEHYISESALKAVEKKLLQFNVKHWDKVPKPIQMLLRVLYGKNKKQPQVNAPPKAVAALSQKLARVGFKQATGFGSGVIMMKAEANESVLGERVTKVKFHGRDQVPEASKLLKKTAAKLFPSVTMRGSRSSDKLIAMWQQPKSEGSKAFEAIKKKATGMGFKKSKPIRGDGEYGGWGSSDAFGLEREDSQEEFAMPPFRLVLGDYGNFKGAMKAPIYSARLYFDGPTYVSLMGKSEEIIRKQRALAGIEDYQEPLQEDDNIGRTILQQMGGAGRIKAMTGGGPFILLPKGVSFKFPNKKRTRGNYVEITLRGDDTYNMEFFNVSVKGKKSVKKYTMIYNDQLISIFEDQTGLYLRL